MFSVVEIPGQSGHFEVKATNSGGNSSHFGTVVIKKSNSMPTDGAGAEFRATWTLASGAIGMTATTAGWQPFRPLALWDCNGQIVCSFYQTVSLMAASTIASGGMGGMGGGGAPGSPESSDSSVAEYMYDFFDAPPGTNCIQEVSGSISPFLPSNMRPCKRVGSTKETSLRDDIHFIDRDHAPVVDCTAAVPATGRGAACTVLRNEPILSDPRVDVFFAAAKAFLASPDNGIKFKKGKSLLGLVTGKQKLPIWVYVGIAIGLMLFCSCCAMYFKFVHGDDKDMPGVHRAGESAPLVNKDRERTAAQRKAAKVGP